MRIYFRGVLASVGDVETLKNGTKVQHCLLQHEFNEDPKWNKYIAFEVFGEERIQQLALQPQEEVEVALSVNAQMGTGGRYFNNIIAFGVERNKRNFHYYEAPKQRVAVVPTANNTTSTNTGAEDD